MTILVYGEKANRTHENQMLQVFLERLEDRWADSTDWIVAVANAMWNGAEIDLVCILPSAIIVADFKSYGGTLTGTEIAVHEGEMFGQCGWYERGGYYDCAANGAIPGQPDPAGITPILCPDGLVEGAACTDDGPVSNVGCCTPDGKNYFCDTQDSMTIFVLDCGA